MSIGELLLSTRFGEALRVVQDNLNSKNFYAVNPEFDRVVQPRAKTADSNNR